MVSDIPVSLVMPGQEGKELDFMAQADPKTDAFFPADRESDATAATDLVFDAAAPERDRG